MQRKSSVFIQRYLVFGFHLTDFPKTGKLQFGLSY